MRAQRIWVRAVSLWSLEAWRAELNALGVSGTDEMPLPAKGVGLCWELGPLSGEAAHALRDVVQAQGGAVWLSAGLADRTAELGRALVVAFPWQVDAILRALHDHANPQVAACGRAWQAARQRLARRPPPTRIGPLTCEWGTRTYVMGILNVTPDSFSGDGLLREADWLKAVVEQARQFVAAGADILDVGGESTRPGAQPVPLEEELRRVVPAVRAIAGELEVAISVDTYKAEVARQAIEAGAHLVNDVWGLRMDPDMARVVAESGVPVIIMHNRSRPKNAVQEQRLGGRYVGVQYEHLMRDVVQELAAQVELARQHGVPDAHIIVDPGIGFGKTVEQNLELLCRLDELHVLGYPVLVGPSRKSFIGYTLDLPPGERLEGTAAAVALSVERGADIVRVHDVREMVRVTRMADAIVRAGVESTVTPSHTAQNGGNG